MKKLIIISISCFMIIIVYGVIQTGINAQENTSVGENAETAQENPYDFELSKPIYDSKGRRDPFETLVPRTPEEGGKIKDIFNYEGGMLRGIVSSNSEYYALVSDSDGFGYVLREGYSVYGGYVKQITEDDLYMSIVKYGRSMSIIMRLESAKNAIIEEVEDGETYVRRPGINIIYKKDSQSQSAMLIDDVVMPSSIVTTIEEEWFGTKGNIPYQDATEAEDMEIQTSIFSQIAPLEDTWITLPYLFRWTSAEGNNITYTIYIDDEADFISPLFVKSGIISTSFLIDEDIDLPLNGKLFWKVTAQDVLGKDVPSRNTDMFFNIKDN